MLGTTIGQYRISQKIGAGGMGIVYLAEHTLLGRPAAVKMLLPELSQNREIVTRFFNEARAATAIRHPGIVEIYDFGFDPNGAAYIVMEHLLGESLATRARRGRISYQNALAITRQVAGALAAAHGKGIVHRDLKPDNVFLVPDPEVQGSERIKLLDFGIAKLAGDRPQDMQQVTQAGALMGTPTYMSPEQCRGVSIDHRSDLYSLGCMLFELCTGRPPFLGEGFGDVLAAHIHLPPPTIASIAPDVPHQLDLLVQRLLVKDPAQRISSAEEVIHAIDLASQAPGYRTGPRLPGVPGAPTGSAAASLTTLSQGAGASSSPIASRRARLGLIAGAGVAVGLAGAIAIFAIDRGRPSTPPGDPPAFGAVTYDPAPSTPPAKPTAPSAPLEPMPLEPTTAPIEPAPIEPAAAPAEPAEVALTIDSQPAGAEVVLDGAALGRTPYRGALPRADREVTLTLRLVGYKERKLVVRPTAPITETVKLDKKRARPTGDTRDDSVNPFAN